MDWVTCSQSFLIIWQQGSLAKAAETLGCARSQLTKRLQWLEQQLSCQLLIRDRQQLQLTDEGAAFLQRCQPFLQSWQQLSAPLDQPSLHLYRDISLPSCILLSWTQFCQSTWPDVHFTYLGANDLMQNQASTDEFWLSARPSLNPLHQNTPLMRCEWHLYRSPAATQQPHLLTLPPFQHSQIPPYLGLQKTIQDYDFGLLMQFAQRGQGYLLGHPLLMACQPQQLVRHDAALLIEPIELYLVSCASDDQKTRLWQARLQQWLLSLGLSPAQLER
ncbi:hypothetical protein VST7929_02416 [Vibrio stylophorae]|uniref:HTH lysR-type domain-containing protein n=1 Tax=Vibrio stylophorae TaxID=659351 RepID=A0ABN8DVY4_9VIBR|nr:LysR family transcriptional regulator [Vibrio stylophorae]CAH0534483.1 hypothetical protein VST7929_02416 [Vibrio stylophorae]